MLVWLTRSQVFNDFLVVKVSFYSRCNVSFKTYVPQIYVFSLLLTCSCMISSSCRTHWLTPLWFTTVNARKTMATKFDSSRGGTSDGIALSNVPTSAIASRNRARVQLSTDPGMVSIQVQWVLSAFPFLCPVVFVRRFFMLLPSSDVLSPSDWIPGADVLFLSQQVDVDDSWKKDGVNSSHFDSEHKVNYEDSV